LPIADIPVAAFSHARAIVTTPGTGN
jgi:hypothetical protein